MTILIYGYFSCVFYQHEKALLLESYHYFRGPSGTEFEMQLVLAFAFFLSLGFISGVRKAVFILFFIEVPLKMVRGEYERYFQEEGESIGVDMVKIGLGLFLSAIVVTEVFGIKFIDKIE